jgi:large-conductance mechanosensitive channel
MWQVEDEFGLAKYAVYGGVDRRSIVGSPTNNLIKGLVKVIRPIHDRIHVAGLTSRTRVDQEVQRAIIVWGNRIQEVVATAEIAQRIFVCS